MTGGDPNGKWIALTGSDYSGYSGTPEWTVQGKNSVYINHWKKGGLVTLNWWPDNPWTQNVYDAYIPAGNHLSDLYTPGNSVYTRWISYLNIKAIELDDLQQNGVVVLWRPFHEMNGNWWWWANQDQAEFIALYQHMFNYFTYTKHLNNLLWVYGPNHYYGSYKSAEYYYPGDT
ncbi:MAG: glycosyl hydrolase [archaeon]